MREALYFDHHTVSKPSLAAIEAMLPFYREHWGTHLAPHQKGQELVAPIERAIVQIYEVLGASFDDSFTFTGSGAEAIAQVFFSTYADYTRETGRSHFHAATVEDPSILLAMQRLQTFDCSSKLLPVDECGRLKPAVVEEALKARSALLSLSWANPLTGVIQPVADLARICADKEVRLHVDASCAIGKQYFRFEGAGIDYLTFDGDRFHAPKGTGGLFCRKERLLKPLIAGPHNINVGALTALSYALKETQQNFDTLCTETARLRDRFESGLGQVFPDAHLFFQEAERLPNVAVVSFPGVAAEALLYALHHRGLYATRGGGSMPLLQEVLKACGFPATLCISALSFALSYETKEEEVDRAVALIGEAAVQLRQITGDLKIW